jgi:chaperone modulatory protein CbpM
MTQTTLNGILLDEYTEVTLNDLCRACSTSAEWIIELVDEGVLEPINDQQPHWRFTGVSLQKAQTAARLHRDLGINTAGIALALELLDEIETLQARLDCLADNWGQET